MLSAPLISKRASLNVSFPCYSSNSSLKFFFAAMPMKPMLILISYSLIVLPRKISLRAISAVSVWIQLERLFFAYSYILTLFQVINSRIKDRLHRKQYIVSPWSKQWGGGSSRVWPYSLITQCKAMHRFCTQFFLWVDQKHAQWMSAIIYLK